MHSATSYDTKLTPHKPSLSSCAWLCHQSALLPGAFFYCPTFDFQRAIKLPSAGVYVSLVITMVYRKRRITMTY